MRRPATVTCRPYTTSIRCTSMLGCQMRLVKRSMSGPHRSQRPANKLRRNTPRGKRTRQHRRRMSATTVNLLKAAVR